MSEKPEHYTPEYINAGSQSNPFSPGYGLGNVRGGPTYIIQQKSLVLAYVLWFFLGYLGIHKFYLRQPIMGVIYILLFGIGSLTAAIIIGWIPLILWGLLMFLDIFTMPIRVRLMNMLANRRVY